MNKQTVLDESVRSEGRNIARHLRDSGMDVRKASVFGYYPFPEDSDVAQMIGDLGESLLPAVMIEIQGNPNRAQTILHDPQLAAYDFRGDRITTSRHAVGFQPNLKARVYTAMTYAYERAAHEAFDESRGNVTLLGERGDLTIFVRLGELDIPRAVNRIAHNTSGDCYHQIKCSEELEV